MARGVAKGCLSVFVIVGVFFGVVGYLLWPTFHPDQKALTKSVELTVVDHWYGTGAGLRTVPDDHIKYHYTVAGHTYEDQTLAVDGSWYQGKRLVACVDPAHPEKYAILLNKGPACGAKYLNTSTATAKRID